MEDAGDPELASLAGRLRGAGGHYRNAELHGKQVRAASYPVQIPAGEGVLTVALATRERDATIMPILMRGLWPNILQIVITLAIILLGIGHSLRPLLALGERIAYWITWRMMRGYASMIVSIFVMTSGRETESSNPSRRIISTRIAS